MTTTKTTTPRRFEDLPEMLTVDEFRHYMRIGRDAAYALVKSGAVRSIKCGRLIRVDKSSLLELGK